MLCFCMEVKATEENENQTNDDSFTWFDEVLLHAGDKTVLKPSAQFVCGKGTEED